MPRFTDGRDPGQHVLTVLGRANSGNVQKVLWCLAELGVPFEREDVGGPFGHNREPDYLALNPNGLVPTLRDGDRVLWESNTIVRYLAARYGTAALWEPDPGRRAAGEKWMDWQLTVLRPGAMSPLFRQLVRTPPAQRDAALIAQSLERTTAAFRILDAALADTPWLGGARFTVADIPCGVFVYRWMALPIERPVLRALEDWYARLAERPAYRRHVMTALS